jgi:hypothetical protein
MDRMKERIAVTYEGKDCLRVIPLPSKDGNAEIKFHFLDGNYTIRKFNFNNEKGGLFYTPIDHGQATHEITYHSANHIHPSPILLPKHKDRTPRNPISDEIINLTLRQIIVPVPVCRITTNVSPAIDYKTKALHWCVDLTERYNTADMYIADKEYNFELMSKRFPMILNFLFPISTIDFLIYGTGMAVEPIFNKMFENRKPIVSFASTIIGEYQFFCRTYQLMKSDAFRMYAKPEYSENNFIEFFNNIDYLDLLATTNICFKLTENRNTPLRPAYKYDLENLKKMGLKHAYIAKLKKRFSQKMIQYKKLKKFRSGIIISQ